MLILKILYQKSIISKVSFKDRLILRTTKGWMGFLIRIYISLRCMHGRWSYD